ncbi:hypothetical protein PHMEG_00026053 [Phytophthora megakarya]|uniref:DDE Tnp4 domain-containing protein n=1 Tax=Phytophthora megakarya TaxID=4795 RepID=A0A225V9I8_9STRA|nr:hypothetical protein PHMEG_00026053 [Phytophthora megakarya]
MLVPFKKPEALCEDNAEFNTLLASARVVNENCIGLLKNRWAFLKGMCTQVKGKEDFVWINDQCMACVLLHNLALVHEDERPFDDTCYETPRSEDESTTRQEGTPSGRALRELIKRIMLASD